jgi:hypothetical protein
MTWDFLVEWQDYTADTIPIEYVWERLRLRRDQLLAASDFRMIPDAPWDRAPWEAYRQALRDLPANTVDPRVAVWPEPPSE